MNSEIDIKKIMEEIRQEIRERGYCQSDIKFEDIPIDHEDLGTDREEFNREEFQKNIDYINARWEVAYYFPIGEGKIRIFIKRVIRKLVKFLIYPMNQDQNEMNASFVRCINQLRNYVDGEALFKVQMDNLEYEFNRQVKKDFAQIQASFLNQQELQADLKRRELFINEQLARLDHENRVLREKLEILTLKCEKLEVTVK